MLRWLEGFDAATHDPDIHARIYASSAASSTSAALEGASIPLDKCLSSGDMVLVTKAVVGSVENSWILGFAVRSNNTSALNNGAIPYIALGIAAGEQVRVEFFDFSPAHTKPGGESWKLRIMRGASELAVSDQSWNHRGANSHNSWVYFEMKITIHDTTGSFEGQWYWARNRGANGAAPFALTWDAANTNVDTKEQGTAGADRMTISFDTGNTNNRICFDDIYLCDSTGAKNNDYLGLCFIQEQDITTSGDGDGDTTDWDLVTATTTEDAWNESNFAIEDDKRLTSDALNQVHLAAHEALVEMATADIIGVRHCLHARMETTGNIDLKGYYRKTTTTAAETEHGDALNVDSTSYEGLANVMEDDPNTATGWANADMDSYQYGVINKG